MNIMQCELADKLTQIWANYTNYDVRYYLVLEALALARRLNYVSGIRFDITEPTWPVFFIILPDIGEVSWHMPTTGDQLWDGSSADDQYLRVKQYAQKYKN